LRVSTNQKLFCFVLFYKAIVRIGCRFAGVLLILASGVRADEGHKTSSVALVTYRTEDGSAARCPERMFN